MPTIDNTRPKTTQRILRKENFADDYAVDSSLKVDEESPVVDVVAPSIPTAVLYRPVGYIKGHADTEFQEVITDFVDYKGHHFKVQVSQDDGLSWETIFVGFCEEQIFLVERADFASGGQKFICYGYAALLDKQPIQVGRAYNPATTSTHDLEWVPAFNSKNSKRRLDFNLAGNRTTEKHDGIYVYSREDGEVWTNQDIAEYCIAIGLPTAEFFDDLPLVGQFAALDAIKRFWPSRKPESLWKWLCKVIDRRFGFGFYLEYEEGAAPEDAGTLSLRVFTTTDADITIGTTTVPANDRPTSIVLDDPYPANHEWEALEFRESNAYKYDRIEVRGERILCVATFRFGFPPGSWGDGSFVKKWMDSLEYSYKQATGANDAEANDLRRSEDRFDSVYSQFGPPLAWPYKHLVFQATTEHFLGYKSDDEGVVTNDDEEAPWYAGFHVFERSLPFHSGTDYAVAPPIAYSEADPPEFRAMMAFARILTGPMAGGYGLLDRMNEADEELKGASFRPLDNIPLGFGISASPRHYWADGHWENAKATNVDPGMDYDFIHVTAAWRLDTRQHVAENLTESGEEESSSSTAPERVLTIDVDDAEYWVVSPETIVDVKDGEPEKIHPDNYILRDDLEKLQGVLAAAKAWHSKDRQAVPFNLHTPRRHKELGVMITSVVGAFFEQAVRAVVTKRTISLRDDGGSCRLETGWYDFDFAGAWSES